MLLSAVERIGDLRREMLDRGVAPEDLGGFDGLESTALVSLAVNANVRMGDPDRAAEYYERAYGLRQDEFMRALLRYRARAGREEEARALIAAIRRALAPGTTSPAPAPSWGSGAGPRPPRDRARLGHATDESRDKQKAWAAEDPTSRPCGTPSVPPPRSGAVAVSSAAVGGGGLPDPGCRAPRGAPGLRQGAQGHAARRPTIRRSGEEQVKWER